jgi:dTDP-4-amino-4,6-dideoxygalactose transaminase
MIPVTKTFLPNINEYTKHLKKAWDKQWITNRGELVVDLEEKLRQYLNVKNIIITNNGTVPLQIALKLLGSNGEIITTPFSYVATTAAIVWENCTPVFVDIHPDYLTIDETKIEAAITPKTTAILATHVFGNPCNVEVIEVIAKKYGLKVIYDAAHCFGVTYNGESIFNYGDISTCSFHATKLFHTGEGGAMFCKDGELNHKLFYSHNFGHNGPVDFFGLGINGKISELQAAMGLSVLPYMNEILEERKKVVKYYDEHITNTSIKKILIRKNVYWNYSYYPVIFESEKELLKIQDLLVQSLIYPRRYFYPSLNTIEYANGGKMPISESIATRILCLPLYVGLTESDLKLICDILTSNLANT